MRNNRLFVMAAILIAVGLSGAFLTSSMSHNSWTRTGMSTMMNMMTDGMMGRGMMNRNQMREMMQRMMPGMLPPGIKPEGLPDPKNPNAALLVRYCTQCHNLPSPKMHTAEEWPLAANRMFARMSMMAGMMSIENPSQGEQKEILAHLKAHSMKSIAPSALPSPESRGAMLFKELCSRCHALPDPKLHSAEEWPELVERMRTNMLTMGKMVMSAEEKEEIEEYLMTHAQK